MAPSSKVQAAGQQHLSRLLKIAEISHGFRIIDSLTAVVSHLLLARIGCHYHAVTLEGTTPKDSLNNMLIAARKH